MHHALARKRRRTKLFLSLPSMVALFSNFERRRETRKLGCGHANRDTAGGQAEHSATEICRALPAYTEDPRHQSDRFWPITRPPRQ